MIHGLDGSSPDHYNPMCVSCHRKYDFTEVSESTREKLRKLVKGIPLKPEHRKKISEARRGSPGRIWSEEEKKARSEAWKSLPKDVVCDVCGGVFHPLGIGIHRKAHERRHEV